MKDVGGVGASEIELRFAAPNRKLLQITSITGKLSVLAAPKMLDVKFDKLKPIRTSGAREADTPEGVKVRLLEVAQARVGVPRLVKLSLAYPAGALVQLQSFQSSALYTNNRVWLSWYDAKSKKQLMLEGNQNFAPSADGSQVTVSFAPSETTPLPPASANVTLHVRTPSRVAEVMVPFAFRDLPLP
jgi:hypothetical protein